MHTRRLLVVRASRGAGMVPIYLAIATLLSTGVLGFVVAVWPAQPRGEGDSASPSRPVHETIHTAPDPRESHGRMRWM
jgi:hypothetical protein